MFSVFTSSIARKLSISFGVTLAIIVGILSFSTVSKMGALAEQATHSSLTSLHESFENMLEAELYRARTLAEAVALLPPARLAAASGDRDALQALFEPAFLLLKQEYGIRQFQFHQPPATSMFRVHKPEKFGDDLSGFRQTVVQVNNTQKSVIGLEEGVAGIGLRAVVPVFHEERHVGSVEFGLSLDQHLFERFKSSFGADIGMFRLKEGKYEALASTLGETALLSDAQLKALDSEQRLFAEVSLDDSSKAVLAVPIHDFSDVPIGVLEISIDQSAFTSLISKAKWESLLIGLLLCALGVVMINVIALRISRPLRSMAESAKQIALGFTDTEVTHHASDETGGLADSFRQMVEYQKDSANAAVQLGRGETTLTLTPRSEHDALGRELLGVARTLQSFHSEIEQLIAAAQSGQLDKRGNVSGFSGDYASMLGSLNLLLDTLAEQAAKHDQEAQALHSSEREKAQSLQHQVDEVLRVVNAAVEGDLTGVIDHQGSDAIGRIGNGLNEFLLELRTSISRVRQGADALADQSGQLAQTNKALDVTASDTTQRVSLASTETESVSQAIDSVAASIQEMSSSIKEISRSTSTATSVAAKAVSLAETTDLTVRQLGESSNSIGNVVKVITSIAEQTNLLALNATIEAARAGDAGKGFAVVANEVKELAKETAKATVEIQSKIGSIQEDSANATIAINDIVEIISEIDSIQTTIASAVEMQSTTVHDIASRVQVVSTGSSNISESIAEVARASCDIDKSTADAQTATMALSDLANDLRSVVIRFKVDQH